MLDHALKFIETLIVGPFIYLTVPGRRIYFLALISSALFCGIYYKNFKAEKNGFWRFLVPTKLIKSPSSLFDLKIFYLNFWINKLLGLGGVGLGFGLSVQIASTLEKTWPDPSTRQVSGLVAATSYTVALFLLEDFSRYWVHKQFHKHPFLWTFHRVHHSAEVLTPLTLHRIHPIEMLLGKLRHTLCFGLLSGLALYLFKDKFSSITILGVEAIGFIFNLMGANLRHSHVFIGYGLLEKFFISPAQHQIHHSNRQEHFDKNFGVFLAIWDRIGGSWYASRGSKNIRFGINLKPERHSFKDQLFSIPKSLTKRS